MSLIKEIDYGTPESSSAKLVTLVIDGKTVTVPEGTSIMRSGSGKCGKQLVGSGTPTLSLTRSRARSALTTALCHIWEIASLRMLEPVAPYS
jgi:hypothetical protein